MVLKPWHFQNVFRENGISPIYQISVTILVCIGRGLERPTLMSKAGGSFKMCSTAIENLQLDPGVHARGDQLLKHRSIWRDPCEWTFLLHHVNTPWVFNSTCDGVSKDFQSAYKQLIIAFHHTSFLGEVMSWCLEKYYVQSTHLQGGHFTPLHTSVTINLGWMPRQQTNPTAQINKAEHHEVARILVFIGLLWFLLGFIAEIKQWSSVRVPRPITELFTRFHPSSLFSIFLTLLSYTL